MAVLHTPPVLRYHQRQYKYCAQVVFRKAFHLYKDLKTELFNLMAPEMRLRGFKLDRLRDRFTRSSEGVTDVFQLVCLDDRPGLRVQPNVAVRHELVEKAFHLTSGFEKKFQPYTATMGNAVGTLQGGDARKCEFLLHESGELLAVVLELVQVFDKFAMSYYKKWRSVQNINCELNDNPKRPTPHRALNWFRCSTGLIVAKMLKDPRYPELVQIYQAVMKEDNNGFYFGRFTSLLSWLSDNQEFSALT